VILDSFAGPVHVEWDTEAALTLPFFIWINPHWKSASTFSFVAGVGRDQAPES